MLGSCKNPSTSPDVKFSLILSLSEFAAVFDSEEEFVQTEQSPTGVYVLVYGVVDVFNQTLFSDEGGEVDLNDDVTPLDDLVEGEGAGVDRGGLQMILVNKL